MSQLEREMNSNPEKGLEILDKLISETERAIESIESNIKDPVEVRKALSEVQLFLDQENGMLKKVLSSSDYSLDAVQALVETCSNRAQINSTLEKITMAEANGEFIFDINTGLQPGLEIAPSELNEEGKKDIVQPWENSLDSTSQPSTAAPALAFSQPWTAIKQDWKQNKLRTKKQSCFSNLTSI